ncbi:hypothetical protein L2E82_29588 [Cichorium intybus]|uniref:Uncharacterized protein n=1 Tax=Cichorium intybus TaxID=13427 RepID=A0ACB9CY11_CICIN|nr:hypothetical protein L2E82_29588 [Cichorium intybus]
MHRVELPDESLMQIPTTGGEFMKEVNLIDDNFSCTDHKAAEMGHEESQNKIQLELNDPLVDVNDAIEAEDNLTNSVIKIIKNVELEELREFGSGT